MSAFNADLHIAAEEIALYDALDEAILSKGGLRYRDIADARLEASTEPAEEEKEEIEEGGEVVDGEERGRRLSGGSELSVEGLEDKSLEDL